MNIKIIIKKDFARLPEDLLEERQLPLGVFPMAVEKIGWEETLKTGARLS